MESIPWASGIDVELRSTRGLARVIATAHQYGRTVIVSHHDFTSTPSLSMLKKLASRASGEGADLFKVATFLRDQRDLRRLIDLQMESSAIQVSAMGMGTAGRFSRLVLAGFGAPQSPSVWPVACFGTAPPAFGSASRMRNCPYFGSK